MSRADSKRGKKPDLPFEKDEKAPWALERQVRFVAGSAGFSRSFIEHFRSSIFYRFVGICRRRFGFRRRDGYLRDGNDAFENALEQERVSSWQ